MPNGSRKLRSIRRVPHLDNDTQTVMAMKTYTNTMLTIIAGVRIKGGSTSLKRIRRARGATRLADRRLGANSAWTWELSAKISERLLIFMTFSTPPFRSAGKATWVSLWTKQNFATEGPSEPVPLISGDLAHLIEA